MSTLDDVARRASRIYEESETNQKLLAMQSKIDAIHRYMVQGYGYMEGYDRGYAAGYAKASKEHQALVSDAGEHG